MALTRCGGKITPRECRGLLVLHLDHAFACEMLDNIASLPPRIAVSGRAIAVLCEPY